MSVPCTNDSSISNPAEDDISVENHCEPDHDSQSDNYVDEHAEGTSCVSSLLMEEALATSSDSNRRATNFLPWEQVGPSSLPINESAEPSIQNTTMFHIFDDDQNSNANRCPSFQNDEIAHLIASMKQGLHESPQKFDYGTFAKNQSMHFASRYADGAGARSCRSDLYMTERNRVRSLVSVAIDASRGTDASWVDILQYQIKSTGEDGKIEFVLPAFIYQEILLRIKTHRSDALSVDFVDMGDFMKETSLQMFIQLYLQKFHFFYSFLDPSLFSIPVWGWALCLATAAIGARFLAVPAITAFSDNLCKLLDEILTTEVTLDS